jgi:protein ImuB
MGKRFVCIWFRHLMTDWMKIRQPQLGAACFVICTISHGRMLIVAANEQAQSQGIYSGMVLADARVLVPSLLHFDEKPGIQEKLLKRLAEWCIRFSPFVAVDLPDCILIDASGCSHLWGGDEKYLQEISRRLGQRGYDVQLAMAGTPGAAWALAHFGRPNQVVTNQANTNALLSLPTEALRLPADMLERLYKLGLRQIKDIFSLQRSSLRRRFGKELLQRIDQATGREEEVLFPVQPIVPFQERLPSLEPICTATGISIALERLLEAICLRLAREQKGLRQALFKCYCLDGRIETVETGTNRATHNAKHIFKLFESKLPGIRPELGIELFVLEAPKVEEVSPAQEQIWGGTGGLDNSDLSELLDRIAARMGPGHIHRYLPDAHYWPERSIRPALSMDDVPAIEWKLDRPRPLQLLNVPERIEVTAPIPDYPPMLFRYKNKLHTIKRAEGPERIEQEWWIQEGQHRDYYYVEDEAGARYWLFRAGHYSDSDYQWFIHGFFA